MTIQLLVLVRIQHNSVHNLIHISTGIYLCVLSIVLRRNLMIESFSHDITMRFMFFGIGVCKADSNCALIPNVSYIGMIIFAVSNFLNVRVFCTGCMKFMPVLNTANNTATITGYDIDCNNLAKRNVMVPCLFLLQNRKQVTVSLPVSSAPLY